LLFAVALALRMRFCRHPHEMYRDSRDGRRRGLECTRCGHWRPNMLAVITTPAPHLTAPLGPADRCHDPLPELIRLGRAERTGEGVR
jgi:hypothetical protein